MKALVKDMVMATLFAESEAFVVANRPTQPPVQTGIRRWGRSDWGKGVPLRPKRDENGVRYYEMPAPSRKGGANERSD